MISLPKGGGAIRGIGEKFGANPVTGTGSMTVPIPTSPARDGFGPQLALSYDSGAGNGPFGFGWTLSLPAITRKTDKGLPRYEDAAESDVFILSGSEDLVPVLDDDGSRFEDSLSVPGYTIHRYRPRIEGLFARIERWTRNPAAQLPDDQVAVGDVHWRSISPDNVLTIYGADKTSRIHDPTDPRRVFSWLICETRDDKGNGVVYDYKPDDAVGIDLAGAHQRNRGAADDPARSTNRYLNAIRYGNTVPLLDDDGSRPATLTTERRESAGWLFEVVFDYGEHDAEVPTPNDHGQWRCRVDSFSSYRAGFEVRTTRLCQRVLMFHHFPGEPEVGADCLVRSTDLAYSHQQSPEEAHAPVYTVLQAVTHSGYRRDGDGYLKRSLPPVEFAYTPPAVQDSVEDVDAVSLENLPMGLDGSAYQWTDLHGEGLPGILTEQADAWFYKRNLSPLTDGHVRLTPSEVVASKPNVSLAAGGQLMDLAGDGQPDVVMLDGPMAGLYEHDGAEGWQPFRSFTSTLNRNLRDPNVKFVDLDGDGHADVLISEDHAFVWHPSLGEDGFGPVRRVFQAVDEEKGPRLVFADTTGSIHLADLSGDGLADLVRIRNGEVCYWPNLGYGRFGAKVTMDQPPLFDQPDQFNPQHLRLADIDGTGTTDLIYLHRNGVRLYFNQSGNSWSHPHELDGFPQVDDLTAVTVADLLGNGTACLVWSSPLGDHSGRPMRYVQLMGPDKPHLLTSVHNNLGAETRVRYAPSTKFYLADKNTGRRWITRLPFPVHLVERVETYDRISRNRFVTRYAYHHGYFDGEEREFRGFGMIEQWDTEEISALDQDPGSIAPSNADAAFHVPPVHTKTWIHTGVYLDRDHVSRQFEGEYWREPGLTDAEVRGLLLADTTLPAGLSAEEEREACRALKGLTLRREIYADDTTPDSPPAARQRATRPYTVVEHDFTIRRVQPRGPNRHAVFLTHPSETISYHYDRKLVPVLHGEIEDETIATTDPATQWLADPRVQHELTVQVDRFGNVLKQASVGYGRRWRDRTLPLQTDRDTQGRTLATYTEHQVTNPIDTPSAYRTPLPCETRTYELTRIQPEHGSARFSVAQWTRDDFALPTLTPEIPYERAATAVGPQKRLIEHTRTLYRPDDFGAAHNDSSALLPLTQLESLALPGDRYQLAFTPGLLTEVFPPDGQHLLADPAAVLGGQDPDQGGYLPSQALRTAGLFPPTDLDDHWWAPAGRTFLSPHTADAAAEERDHARAHFFHPRRFRDPFGHTTTVSYDPYDLLVCETVDAVGNRVTAGERQPDDTLDAARPGNDYRVLQPRLVTDPNRNRTEVAFDALGLVVGTAVMGKPEEDLGDNLAGFRADLTETDTLAHLADPFDDPHTILADATSRLVYDLFAYQRTSNELVPAPAVVATLTREVHAADLGSGEQTPIQHNFSYSDGFEREIQHKIQAEPGPLVDGGPDVSPRWVATGWTVYNNKGKPVRQYEPFFSHRRLADGTPFSDHRFEFAVQVGVSPVLFYDPAERVVATLHPNHTYEKVAFDPWQQVSYDVNDTVAAHGKQTGDPRTDPDIAGFVTRYLPQDDPTWQTWLAQRLGTGVSEDDADAASKATAHADTPTTAYFDTLGRTFLTRTHNGFSHDVPVRFDTRVVLDIQGNQRAVIDAEGRTVMTYSYDMPANPTRRSSMEAGQRCTLSDVAGNVIRAWDSRGHSFTTKYDALRRPTNWFVEGHGPVSDPDTLGAPVLYQRAEYGEDQPNAAGDNLRGRLFRQYDGAGVVMHRYDFKGNVTGQMREIAAGYKTTINWATAQAEGERFVSATRYDALNRSIQTIPPHLDDAAATRNVVQARYNEANLLQKLCVWTGRSTAPDRLLDPAVDPPSEAGVDDIDYNAKGQRTHISYRNGVTTTYDYDPQTFRVIHLYTRRSPTFTNDCGGTPPPPLTAAPEKPPAGKACGLQNLHYTYDPAGNITHIRDAAQQTIFFRNKIVDPSNDYTYDPTYRLVKALGREHVGQAGGTGIPHDYNDLQRKALPHPGDGNAMSRYCETYTYDRAGNIRKMNHRQSCPGATAWSRTYVYDEVTQLEDRDAAGALQYSNRLSASTVDGVTETYSINGDGYDPHGNMVRMPQLQQLAWDSHDRLRMTRRQAINPLDAEGTARHGERTYYVYDSAGQRVRKVTEGATGALKEERLYLGGLEIYRKHSGHNAGLRRETLHITDDMQRIALVELRNDVNDGTPTEIIRYQLGNHLASCNLEVDEQGKIISYEEYAPYGSTTYQAVRTDVEVAVKRYRYTGKERDEESGFNYHSARYYCAELGRWTAPDPAGLTDGENLYAYASQNPVAFADLDGTRSATLEESLAMESLREREDAALKSFTKLSTAGQIWDYFFSGSGPVRQAARARYNRESYAAAINRAAPGEAVQGVPGMARGTTNYITQTEAHMTRQLALGSAIANSALASATFVGSEVAGASFETQEMLTLSASDFSDIVVNTGKVVTHRAAKNSNGRGELGPQREKVRGAEVDTMSVRAQQAPSATKSSSVDKGAQLSATRRKHDDAADRLASELRRLGVKARHAGNETIKDEKGKSIVGSKGTATTRKPDVVAEQVGSITGIEIKTSGSARTVRTGARQAANEISFEGRGYFDGKPWTFGYGSGIAFVEYGALHICRANTSRN